MQISNRTTSSLGSVPEAFKSGPLDFSTEDFAQITRLNNRNAAGFNSAYDLVKLLRSRLTQQSLVSIRETADDMDDVEAENRLGILGFITSSVESNFRKVCEPGCDGFAFAAFPALEGALTALGYRLGRYPRDDCFTAWINNPPYTWTGSDGEIRFGAAVRDIDAEMNFAADLLIPIRKGEDSLADSVEALREASNRIKKCKTIMADLANKPFKDEFQAMRNFLIPMIVNGRRYEPPNATYAPGWNRLDVAVGNHDDRFTLQLDERVRHMASSDVAKIVEEKRLPSITQIVACSTGTGSDFMSPDRIAAMTASLDQTTVEAVKAAAELAKTLSILAGVHMGAIRKNLPEAEDDTNATHSAGNGVSGRPVSLTQELRDMRIHHPLTRTKLS